MVRSARADGGPVERQHEVAALHDLLDQLARGDDRRADGLGLIVEALDRKLTAGGIDAEMEILEIR